MRHGCWFSRKCLGLLLAGLTLLLFGCGKSGSTDAPTDAPDLTVTADSMTIDRVLRTDDRFSTLVAALDSTNLDSTLAGDGPYTLFAPPNSAFARMPDGTMDVLLTERTDQLRAILAHHVVDGRVGAAQLADTAAVVTFGGDSLRVRSDSALTAGAATVVDDDVAVANGLIHVLNRVLRPPPDDE
jgi:uncharacterized surface protein with fasciclin (FAS1) repeats